MNGGNLCELARILGHASIEKASRLATLGWQRMAKTGSPARERWSKGMGTNRTSLEDVAVLFPEWKP